MPLISRKLTRFPLTLQEKKEGLFGLEQKFKKLEITTAL